MKYLISLIMTVSISSNAATQMELCTAYEKTSRTIMKMRQSGVPLLAMLNAASSKSQKIRIVDAYKQPRFSTDDYVKKSIEAFSNKHLLLCISSTMASK